jgi:hypothetical protein
MFNRMWFKIGKGLGLILPLSFILLAACSTKRPTEQVASEMPQLSSETANPTQKLEATSSQIGGFTAIPTSPQETPLVSSTPEAEGIPMLNVGSESRTLELQEREALIQDAGLKFMRYNGLLWPRVEPQEGERKWNAIGKLEKKLADASATGVEVILIIRGTPEWAQKVPGSSCGPIKPNKLESFADFMGDVVRRYSVPPYSIKYWELGNEPDVAPSLVAPDSVFGCWGDENDPYYGGGYYAEMLKAAYPAIKSADPEANVLIGGLLLDCDPAQPPEGQDCLPGKFFEGILQNGGGPFFDYVSYHGYAPYAGSSSGHGGLYLDEHFPNWEHRGGVLLGKIDFLRELMQEYNVDKPLFHSEGSLICPGSNQADCDPPGESFFESQADYVVWLFIRDWAEDVKGAIWYPFEGPGWRFGGLLDENQEPKPAYRALSFLTKELEGATYTGRLTDFPEINGYEFITQGKRIWVLWSPSEQPQQISLSEDVLAIYDKYGDPIEFQSGEVSVSSPIYVELTP